VSLQPRDREYLIAKVESIDAAIEDLRPSAQSPRDRAALELLIATREKMTALLALERDENAQSP
jgi:hypothetical protein